jgi:hypothetical protein
MNVHSSFLLHFFVAPVLFIRLHMARTQLRTLYPECPEECTHVDTFGSHARVHPLTCKCTNTSLHTQSRASEVRGGRTSAPPGARQLA